MKIFNYVLLIFMILPSCKNESLEYIDGKYYDYEYRIFLSSDRKTGPVIFPKNKPLKTDSVLIGLAVDIFPKLLGVTIPKSVSIERCKYYPTCLLFSFGNYSVQVNYVSINDTNFVDSIFMYMDEK